LNRFIKDYKLVITTSTKAITITPPLNIEFNAEKSALSYGLNRLNLKVFNLSEANRNLIVKDKEGNNYIGVELSVGYVNNMKQVFKGNVSRAYPEKNGTEIVSVIECMDGLFDVKESFTSATASTKLQAVEIIVGNMMNTEIGKISRQNTIYRDKVIMGNSYEELKKLLQPDELMYIEDEKLYIIKENESAENYVTLISAETGLMNTPKRENKIVELDTRMNPAIKIGGQAKLESIYAPYLNGVYRIDTARFVGSYDGDAWDMTIKMRQGA